MMMIRKFSLKTDLEQFSVLFGKLRSTLRSFSSINQVPTEINQTKINNEIANYIDNDAYTIFVAISENQLAGFIVIKCNDGVFWLEFLYVDQKFRRRGIASALWEHAEAFIRKKGKTSLYVWIHPNNQEMIDFLRYKNCDTLNLIELRKDLDISTNANRKNKKKETIKIGKNTFYYG